MVIDYRFLDSLIVVKKVFNTSTERAGTGLISGDMVVKAETAASSPNDKAGIFCYTWGGNDFETAYSKIPEGRFILNLDNGTVYQVGSGTTLTTVKVLGGSNSGSGSLHHVSYEITSFDLGDYSDITLESNFTHTVNELSNVMLFVNNVYQVNNADANGYGDYELKKEDSSLILDVTGMRLEGTFKEGDIINLYYSV